MSEAGEGAPKTIETQERKIASTIEELPPLKKNHIRLIHTTNPNNVKDILEKGLNYEVQGMIDSTARAFADPENIEYYSEDPRFSWKGAKSVILDIPIEEHRLHRDVTKSPGVVPAKYIVGVIEAHRGKV